MLPFDYSQSSLVRVTQGPSTAFEQQSGELRGQTGQTVFHSHMTTKVNVEVKSFVSLGGNVQPVRDRGVLTDGKTTFSLPSLGQGAGLLAFF